MQNNESDLNVNNETLMIILTMSETLRMLGDVTVLECFCICDVRKQDWFWKQSRQDISSIYSCSKTCEAPPMCQASSYVWGTRQWAKHSLYLKELGVYHLINMQSSATFVRSRPSPVWLKRRHTKWIRPIKSLLTGPSLRLKFPLYSCLWVKALKAPGLKIAIIITAAIAVVVAPYWALTYVSGLIISNLCLISYNDPNNPMK